MKNTVITLSYLLFLISGCGPATRDERPAPSGGDEPSAEILYGADQILEEPHFSWIRGKKVGLITNQTGVTSELRSLIEVLENAPDVDLVALFGPEHGISGQAQAGVEVASGPRVFSLYGDTRTPTQEMLEGIEVLIYDIQDVGARFYTFISTMYESMEAASQAGIPFIVLDRPNPIGGTRVEGPVLEKGFESFVGISQIPIRYGMTAGELATLLKEENGLNLDLRVVPVRGWKRDQWFDSTGFQWIAPSPNMPTLTTATVYPGFCLIEGTNLSEGRGTTRPFELVGAPWLNSGELARRLNQLNLPGVYFRPQAFTPMFSKHSSIPCEGVQVHVTDREIFDPLAAVLHLIRETSQMHPDQFEFRVNSFDRLAGNSWIREMILSGDTVESIIDRWQPERSDFENVRLKYLLY